MKRIFNALLTLILAFCFISCAAEIVPEEPDLPVDKGEEIVKWDGSVDCTWAEGDGEKYEIKAPSELAGLAKLVNEGRSFKGKTIELTEDIDLAGLEWMPIGSNIGKDIEYSFDGAFDGKNHVISNLKISDTVKSSNEKVVLTQDQTDGNEFSYGLFGRTNNAVIKNLKLDNVDINLKIAEKDGYKYVPDAVGALIGFAFNETVIDNIEVNGSIYGTGGTAGVVGRLYSDKDNQAEKVDAVLSNITNNIKVESARPAGGIISIVSKRSVGDLKITVKDCVNNGSVSSVVIEKESKIAVVAAGILGQYGGGADLIIENCINNGKITADDKSVEEVIDAANIFGKSSKPRSVAAGILGEISGTLSSIKITGSENNGNITAQGTSPSILADSITTINPSVNITLEDNKSGENVTVSSPTE